MMFISQQTRWSCIRTGAAVSVVALIGLMCGVRPAYAEDYATPLSACDPIPSAPGASCMDDVTDCGLNCTSNDVQLAVYNVFGTCEGGTEHGNGCFVGNAAACDNGGGECISNTIACTEGQMITVYLQAEVIATSNERWDIGIFIATDGGDALTGDCYRDFLNGTPLEPGTTGDCTPVCNPGGGACFKDDDCPGGTCDFGYNPNGGAGPFYDGECTEDPNDLCGDLEQLVPAFLNLDPITILCQDADGNGLLDLGTCTSWDNARSDGSANKPSCLTEDDTLPNTPAKCRCEPVAVGEVIVCDPATCGKCEACSDLTGNCEPVPGCCDDDTDCPVDEKCLDHFCDLATNTCASAPIPGCCDDDIDCPVDEKCLDHFCNLANNTCASAPIPGCCDDDIDCPVDEKCLDHFCNLANNTCASAPIPDCCDDDIDCPPDEKCLDHFCDLATNTCQSADIPGCCDDDIDCPDDEKCLDHFCDLATNTCQSADIPGCCDDDTDCPEDVKCLDHFCDLATNTCVSAAIPGCCDADVDCPVDEKCVDHFCDLTSNTCQSAQLPNCCSTSEDCPPNHNCIDNVCVSKKIPTVSQWGLITMVLLLLAGAKVYYGRRRFEAA